ncbi:DUF2931 family protein [Sphingobacterium sp. Mn56C]|uniref:DUF2931 family protein n=1 Tax=Sphingobacterium sp. Mn56C TaxID=3395261 RepID=UPI003BD0D7FD
MQYKKYTQQLFLLMLLSAQQASCKQQIKEKTMAIEQFKWEESTNAPLGYPAEVYQGGLELASGGFVGLFHGTIPGDNGWGSPGSGMSSGAKTLPNKLDVKYLSYAENQFYYANCPIDYDKLVRVFKEPLQRRGAMGNLLADHFDQVNVGFAPGGVVVVWASGPGHRVEIGRYQAEKTVIPESEINRLDGAAHLIFEETEVERVMHSNSIIPLAVQAANKNKPIPFGLWDSYRKKYHWRPIFQIQQEGKMRDFSFTYFNGERNKYFYENNIQSTKNSELFYQEVQDSITFAIPSSIGFSWFAKDSRKYSGYFRFNEQEIFQAFHKLCASDTTTHIEMLIRTNIPNSYATVLLRNSQGKEIALIQHDDEEFFQIKR